MLLSMTCIVCKSNCGCWRLSNISWTAFLILICCSMLNAQHVGIFRVNKDSTLDMSNYTEMLLILGCPEPYDHIGWCHDGRHLEDRDQDGKSLLYPIKGLEDGGVFKCGPANDPVDTWRSINITIGRKPSKPQNLVCTGHLYDKASCTWERGSRKTNLPVTFIAQKKSGNNWVNCSKSDDNVCNISRPQIPHHVRVQEVNELGSSAFAEAYYVMDNDVRPFPPTDLTLSHNSERKILASWGCSEGWQGRNDVYLEYQLRHRVISSLSTWHKVPDDGMQWINVLMKNQYNLENLKVYTTYEVQIRARYIQADAPGMWSTSVNITTQEDYPVGQVQASYKETESDDDDKETYRNIILTWKVPEMMKARGKILGFEIQLLENGVHFNTSRLNDGSITQHTFKNLLRDANYTVIISAHNSVSSSTPYILNIAPSPANIVPSAVITAVVVSIAIVVILLVLGIVWKRIKKVEICLPLPEPNFNILKWKHIPNARAYVEDEVFDETRQRRAVPTKAELDKLMRKLPDPALKDVILELLISKYSIDHEWQKIQQRKSRLLSNNTEISFLSDDDDDGEDLGTMPGCKNTVLSNFQRECSRGLARHHSLPILDEKYTKDDVNMKEEAYTSSSGDTSGIGSESSDQDLESECQMMLCHSLPDVHCISPVPAATLGKPNTISHYTESVGIPKVSQKSHVNVPSLHEKHGYISARDVAKVVQLPINDPRNRSQRTTQSNVSEYLDAAQMRQLQNHQPKQKQLRHMQNKPKASDNGYVDVKDMHKFVGHLPKIPAKNMPKPSVYVQHEELPALLANINPSSSNKSPHPEVDPNVEISPKSSSDNFNVMNDKQDEIKQNVKSPGDTQMCPEVNRQKCHNDRNNNEDVISKVSPYVKGASIISPIRPSPKSHPKSSDREKQKVDGSGLKESVTSAAPTCRYPINTNISNEPEPTSTKSLACSLPSNKPSTDYITLKYTHGHPPSQATHLNKTHKEQKLSPCVNGLQHNVKDLQKRASHSAQRLPPSKTSDLQNASALARQIPPSGTSALQNINGSALTRQSSPSVTSDSHNINGSVLPRRSPLSGTSGSRNINGSVLPRRTPPSGTSASQHISGSAFPRRNVQLNNSKANQDGGYIPILSLANSSSTASSSVKQRAQLPIHQTTVLARSHFQNQGRMTKGQFKSAKFIYKVSPSL